MKAIILFSRKFILISLLNLLIFTKAREENIELLMTDQVFSQKASNEQTESNQNQKNIILDQESRNISALYNATERDNYKENTKIDSLKYRFVFSIINSGDSSPSSLDSDFKDILGEYWQESSQELTSVGARKHYLLGYRNFKRYESFLSLNYLYNDFFLMTQNSTRASQSIFSHMQGMYPTGKGKIITDDQIPKAKPNTTIDSDIVSLLQNDALLNRQETFRTFTLQDYDLITGLENPNLCEGVIDYVDDSIDDSPIQTAYKNFKDQYEKVLIECKIISNDKDEVNITEALLLSDTFLKAYHHSKDLSKFQELTNINITEFEVYSSNLIQKNLSFSLYNEFSNHKSDWDRYIARISSSKVIRMIKQYIQNRIDRDTKVVIPKLGEREYMPEFPKYVVLSLTEQTFMPFSQFLSLSLNTIHDVTNKEASSFQFELLSKDKDKDNLTLEDFHLRVIYNDDDIFDGTPQDFKDQTEEKEVDDDEINDFCVNYFESQTEKALIISAVVLGVVALGMSIYAACLKIRKNSYLEMLHQDISGPFNEKSVARNSVASEE